MSDDRLFIAKKLLQSIRINDVKKATSNERSTAIAGAGGGPVDGQPVVLDPVRRLAGGGLPGAAGRAALPVSGPRGRSGLAPGRLRRLRRLGQRGLRVPQAAPERAQPREGPARPAGRRRDQAPGARAALAGRPPRGAARRLLSGALLLRLYS